MQISGCAPKKPALLRPQRATPARPPRAGRARVEAPPPEAQSRSGGSSYCEEFAGPRGQTVQEATPSPTGRARVGQKTAYSPESYIKKDSRAESRRLAR